MPALYTAVREAAFPPRRGPSLGAPPSVPPLAGADRWRADLLERPKDRGFSKGESAAPLALPLMTSITKRISPKQIIIQKGDPGSSLYVVVSGRVKVTAPSPDGKEFTFDFLGPGEYFGEMAVLDGTDHSATVTAVDATVLQVIAREEFLATIERDPRAALSLVATLCGRLRRTSQMVEDMSFLAMPVRLAKQLVALAAAYGVRTSQGTRIGLRLCQQELANLVGTSRESINKQLRAWQHDGLIAIRDGLLLILRMSELSALAGS